MPGAWANPNINDLCNWCRADADEAHIHDIFILNCPHSSNPPQPTIPIPTQAVHTTRRKPQFQIKHQAHLHWPRSREEPRIPSHYERSCTPNRHRELAEAEQNCEKFEKWKCHQGVKTTITYLASLRTDAGDSGMRGAPALRLELIPWLSGSMAFPRPRSSHPCGWMSSVG